MELKEIQKDYIVIVNGRPFFSVSNPCNLQMVVNEARSRFGGDVKIEIVAQITEPYAFTEGDGK